MAASSAHALDERKAITGGSITLSDLSPSEALRRGAQAYYAGNKGQALDSLTFAAKQGHPMAAWKLGQMYAVGDGVAEDDEKAFEYFRQVATDYAEETPGSSSAPFVASAFVALGGYYQTGIVDSAIKPNIKRARDFYTYAASYFGDADAQFHLGMLYLSEPERSSHMAARWLKLAAEKGHIAAQARLGELLLGPDFNGQRDVFGLMWLTVARKNATSPENHWVVELQERYFGLADEAVRRNAVAKANRWAVQHGHAITAAAN